MKTRFRSSTIVSEVAPIHSTANSHHVFLLDKRNNHRLSANVASRSFPLRHLVATTTTTTLLLVVVAILCGNIVPASGQNPPPFDFTSTVLQVSPMLVNVTVVFLPNGVNPGPPQAVSPTFVFLQGSSACSAIPSFYLADPQNLYSYLQSCSGNADNPVPDFNELLGNSVVAIDDEGVMLVGVDTATQLGGSATYVIPNVFANSTPQVVHGVTPIDPTRVGGALFRVRVAKAGGGNDMEMRYFLVGGSSDEFEELIVESDPSAAAYGGVSLRWKQITGATMRFPDTTPSRIVVLYPAGVDPVGVYVPDSNPSTLNQLIGTFSLPDFAPLTLLAGSVTDRTLAITTRESFVIATFNSDRQLYIVQFGGPQGQDINAAIATATESIYSIPCSLDNTIFMDPGSNNLFVSCGSTVYASRFLNATIVSATTLYPNPNRNSGRRTTPVVTVEVVYANYPTTSLLMFSLYDDCSQFIPDGSFALDGGADGDNHTLRAPLWHVKPGQRIYVCTTLGHCPATSSCSSGSSSISEYQDCVAAGMCLYNNVDSPYSALYCCDRSPFATTAPGVAPTGSLWMLSVAAPIVLLTVTPSASVTDTLTDATVTDIETITATMTLSQSVTLSAFTATSSNSTTPSNSTSLSFTINSTSTVSESGLSVTASFTNTSGNFTPTASQSRTLTATETISLSSDVSETHTEPRKPTPTILLTPSTSPTHSTSLTNSTSLVVDAPHRKDWTLYIAIGAAGAVLLLIIVGALVLRRRRMLDASYRRDAMSSQPLNSTDDVRLATQQYDSTSPTYSTLIDGTKYSISKLLGKGGYGMVFLCHRKSDGREGALKYITCRTDYDRELAMREFEVIMKVQHPNIIPIWEFLLNWQEHVDTKFLIKPQSSASNRKGGPNSNAAADVGLPMVPGILGDVTPFQNGDNATTALTRPRYVAIVTKYYPEGDLKRYCYLEKKHGNSLAEDHILSLMLQITTLIVKLHDQEQQIVHRDLKPENILLDRNYRMAVVTDFGLAFNNVDEASHMTTQAGSLPFVAPECWSKHYNAKVDVWSLGCMLYAMCTQRVTGDDSRVMFNDVDEPWFADELHREVVVLGQYSHELFEVMMKMLVKDPSRRLSAYETEVEITAIMERRKFSMDFILPTPLPRPQHALDREKKDIEQRRLAEEQAARELAAKRAAREQRKQQRQHQQQMQQQLARSEAPR